MLDEEFQEQCRQFRSFSKQSEKFTCLNRDVPNIGHRIQSSSTRARPTLRSSLSSCFANTSPASQMDFSRE